MMPSSGLTALGRSEQTWRLTVLDRDSERRKRVLRNDCSILPVFSTRPREVINTGNHCWSKAEFRNWQLSLARRG